MDTITIDAVFAQWREAYDMMQAATFEDRAEVAAIQARIAELEAPYREHMEKLERLLTGWALANRAGFKAHGVQVSYRKDYARVTWDGKALDGYAAAHPEIERFRTTTLVAPSVTVKRIED